MRILEGDIVEQDVDVIVNASNGIGWMGGIVGRFFRLKGVAESIHYATRGLVEKESRQLAKRLKPKLGDVFVTSAGNLKARHIYHAVTMRRPGRKSRLRTIETCVDNILKQAKTDQISSIAIPLLGTGTGRLSSDEVLEIYKKRFEEITQLDIIVVMYHSVRHSRLDKKTDIH